MMHGAGEQAGAGPGFGPDQWRWVGRALLPLMLLSPPAALAGGTELLQAVAGAPALEAARLRAEAARERLGAAGRFPDPEVEVMAGRMRMAGDSGPMWEVGLTQPLPKPGERAADRERAAALVSMAEAEYAVMAGEMAAEAAMALAEAAAAQARAAEIRAQIARTADVRAALDARIASGSGRMAELLALESAVARMRLMLAQEERMAADAQEEARALLGLRPEAPLPAYAAPDLEAIDPERAPQGVLAAARGAEARAMARMARAGGRPMTAVGVRFAREEETMGSKDTFAIAFMAEIPWRARGYARIEERAARAEQRAAMADAEAVRHRVLAAKGRAERAARLADAAARLAAETRQRLDAEYAALLRAASTAGMGGENPVLMILEIFENRTDSDLQRIDAAAAAQAAHAALWAYAPVAFFTKNLFGTP